MVAASLYVKSAQAASKSGTIRDVRRDDESTANDWDDPQAITQSERSVCEEGLDDARVERVEEGEPREIPAERVNVGNHGRVQDRLIRRRLTSSRQRVTTSPAVILASHPCHEERQRKTDKVGDEEILNEVLENTRHQRALLIRTATGSIVTHPEITGDEEVQRPSSNDDALDPPMILLLVLEILIHCERHQ